MTVPVDTVDAYLAGLTPLRRQRLSDLRALVHTVAPDVGESIEWKMPVYRCGERYVATASQKNYVSVYIGQDGVNAVLAAVQGMKAGKGCLNIGDTTDLPLAAIEAALRMKFGR